MLFWLLGWSLRRQADRRLLRNWTERAVCGGVLEAGSVSKMPWTTAKRSTRYRRCASAQPTHPATARLVRAYLLLRQNKARYTMMCWTYARRSKDGASQKPCVWCISCFKDPMNM